MPSSSKSPDAIASGRGCSPENRRFSVWFCSDGAGGSALRCARATLPHDAKQARTKNRENETRGNAGPYVRCDAHIFGASNSPEVRLPRGTQYPELQLEIGYRNMTAGSGREIQVGTYSSIPAEDQVLLIAGEDICNQPATF
jgi:hypothetical protein